MTHQEKIIASTIIYADMGQVHLHGASMPAGNSTYPKGGVSCSKDSLVVNGSLVFQIRFCYKSPALRVAANRCSAFKKTT